MSVEITTLENNASGLDFRSILNTNFQNLKQFADSINKDSLIYTLYTTEWSESTEGIADKTVQVCITSSSIKVGQLLNNEWTIISELSTNPEGLLLDNSNNYIGVTNEGAVELEGLPVGYLAGVLVQAGLTTDTESTYPVAAIGIQQNNKLITQGVIETDLVADALPGQVVYLSQDEAGYTLIKPTETGSIVQILGHVNNDKTGININVCLDWGVI